MLGFIKEHNKLTMCLFIYMMLLNPLAYVTLDIAGGINLQDPSTAENCRNDIRAVNKNLTFYLHEATSAKYVFDYSTTAIMNTMVGSNQMHLTDWGTVITSWYLHPTLAGDFHIQGDIEIAMKINMSSESNNLNGNLDLKVYDVEYIDAVGTKTETLIPSASGSKAETFLTSIDVYGVKLTGIDYTVKKGHSIRVEFEVSGGAGNKYHIWYGDDLYDSHIVFGSQSYLQVNDIYAENYNNEVKTNFELDVSNKTIYIKTNVTDPFGGYDIKMVNMTLVSPTGSTIIDNAGMTKFQGTNISLINKYEYEWNYSGAEAGRYNVTVWAVDYNGYNFYYHRLNFDFGVYTDTGIGYFFIGGKPLKGNVTVQDSLTQPLPGALVKAQLGGTTKYINTTNATGVAGLEGYPGIYTVIVEWQGIIVKTQSSFDFKTGFPLTLVCDVFYPQFKIVDNSNNALQGANVYIGHPNGSFNVAPFITDENGLISLDKTPIGDYQVIVKWRDVEVANVIELVESNGLIVTIVCQVFSVQLTVVDSKGIGLPKAQIVIVNDLSKLVLDSQISSLTGVITSQLPVGDYEVSVYWLQRMVKQFDLNLVNDYTETITCDVYYVNFLVLDTHSETVDNALIVLTDPETDALFESDTSNSNGLLESRLPAGESDLKVYWKNILVNTTTVLITGDVPVSSAMKLNCDIYYLTLNCYDSRSIPVQNAQIEIVFNSNSKFVDAEVTDEMGTVVFRLPVSSYDFNVIWMNVEVYSQNNLALNSDAELDLICEVYYINITPVDSRDLFLENARIDIYDYNTGDLLLADTVSDEGKVLFRLPSEMFLVEITWLNINVCSSVQTVTEDADVIIKCSVFYISIKPVDSQSEFLVAARIDIYYKNTSSVKQTNIVGSEGTALFRLPAESYFVKITWLDINVSFTTQKFTQDDNIIISCKVFYLTFHVVDFTNTPVENAKCFVNYNLLTNIYDSGITDSQGNIISRLPMGDYSISVYWKDVQIFQADNASLTKDRTYICNSKIYYLDVKVIDSEKVKLKDVLVTITNIDTNPELIESGYTNSKGFFSFRLPYGTYTVKGRYITTYLWQDIDQKVTAQVNLMNNSVEVELKFKDYPPPAYTTPVFGVATFAAILIVILLLLWFFVIRKLQKHVKEGKGLGIPEPEVKSEIKPPSALPITEERPSLPEKAEPEEEPKVEAEVDSEKPPESVQKTLDDEEE